MKAPSAAMLAPAAALALLAGAVRADTPATIDALPQASLELDTEAPVPDARGRAREHYAALLAAPDVDAALSAEALRRLADLMLEIEEESQSLAGREQLAGDDYERAVVLYRRWLDENPDHPQSDEVLYQLARAHELGADPALALAALDELVHRWPASEHLAEAHFRRGELLFGDGRYAEAERGYQSVLASSGAGPFERQARYKLGWSLYRQSEYARSHDAFASLLALLPAPQSGELRGSRAERELMTDTLRVMALGFAAEGGREELDASLAGWSLPRWTSSLYRALGELYLEQERFHDAYDAFAALGRTAPMDASAPALALRGIDALEDGAFSELVLEAREAFVERYAPDQPYWQVHAPEDHPEVMDGLLSSIEVLARHAHALAQQTGDASHRARAIAWYDRRLTQFPRGEDAAATHFLMAELLLESGDGDAAADAFEATAYDYPPHERSAEAGYAAVLARRPLNEAALPVAVTAYARTVRRFATAFPQHEQATAALVDAAERAYAATLHEEALGASAQALAAQPSAEQARVAWLVAGHTHFDLGANAEAEQAYWQAHALADETGSRTLERRLAIVIHRQGEAARANGDHLLAVAHFNRLVERLPESDEAPVAMFDAGMALLALDEHEAAVRTLQRFRGGYPDHALAERVGENLAFAHEALGQWSEAAEEYTRLASEAGDTPEARAARWHAAELHARAGDRGAEQTALELIVAHHPRPFDEAVEARARLQALAAERGDLQTELRWARALVVFEAEGPSTARSRTLAARAALRLADGPRERFHAVRLVHPLEDALALKRRHMEDALEAYAAAAAYGIADVLTAATFEIAELYGGLAAALLDSERPSDLDALAAEQYELLLEEQAFPFEEQAIGIHEANAARAAEGMYDRWVEASLARLAELLPARWDKMEQGERLVSRIR